MNNDPVVDSVVVRVQLESASKERLDALCAAHRTSQIELMSKLLDWFVNQNEVIQMGVLGMFSNELLANFAGKMLHNLQTQITPPESNQSGEFIL